MRRRRTRRCSAVTALASRGATVLQAWLWLIVFIFQNEFRISDSIQPGYLDFDNLPDTNFTCTGKVIGGYYADLETSCQMFHVCTVGQGDEPMDIKFLCLNGTVFDQETRVCERVDEVDCTKSEKFYSLNLELYGSTAAPAIEPEHESVDSAEDKSRDKSSDKSKESHDPRPTSGQPDPTPQADPVKNEHTEHVEPMEEDMEPEEEVLEEDEQDYDDYTHSPVPSTTTSPPTTTRRITTTTTTTTTLPPPPSTASPAPTYGVPSDPSLLSPHEFTYQHRPAPLPSPPVPALSFQRQSYPQHAQPPRLTLTSHRASSTPQPPPRPADHVYITAAPQDQNQFSELEQIDHYELYESSKNAPRRPANFFPPRTPQGFRPAAATAVPPRSQLPSPGQYDNRPIQSYQPSERHEILYDDRFRPPPPQPTFEYSRFHFDRKRSHETVPSESSESIESRLPPLARSASSTQSPPLVTSTVHQSSTRRPIHKTVPKSPPRVIVTASASVSDSNGKKLNYTVGNVVSAVKPIVNINYDDYKESDIIFDPFFLDVPKLKRRRKNTEKRSAAVVVVPKRAALLVVPPKHQTTTPPWLPPDYVDDNYEPQTFAEALPAEPPKAVEKNNSVPLKIAVSSQSVATEFPAILAERRKSSKVAVEMERLLAALPPPGGGEFRVVHAGRPARFSCENRPTYRTLPDSRDCRIFHVCAGSSMHVELKCSPGLRFDITTNTCVTPRKGDPPCSALLDNV